MNVSEKSYIRESNLDSSGGFKNVELFKNRHRQSESYHLSKSKLGINLILFQMIK